METIFRERVQTVPQELVAAYATVGVGDLGHILQFGFMNTGIRPVWRDIRLVGTALTVRMPSMDIGLNRNAIAMAQPGDVIVVDRRGDTEIAGWGGFAGALAKAKGIAGLIVDGAVTDTMEFTDLRWPVYSRSVSGLVGRNQGMTGEINTTIDCSGVPVSPGDLIVADDDGILVIRPEMAEYLLRTYQERFGQSQNIRQWIRAGKPLIDLPGVRQFLDRT